MREGGDMAHSRLTDGAVLFVGLLLAVGLCALITLVELIFMA